MSQIAESKDDSGSINDPINASSENESDNSTPPPLIPLNKEQDLSRKSPPRYVTDPRKCLINLTMDESLHKKYGSDTDARARRAERTKKRVGDIENLTVSFDRVIIREYPICLGNNPSVSRGPPLTIDWDPMTHLEFDFVQLQDSKLPSRGQAEMFVPLFVRERMLKNAGYSRKEIMKMVKDVNISRIQRRKTIANLKYHKLELGVEKVKRKLSKVFRSKDKVDTLEWSALKALENEYRPSSQESSVGSSEDESKSVIIENISEHSVNTEYSEDANVYLHGDEKEEAIP